jgi:penicillin-binding protein 1C
MKTARLSRWLLRPALCAGVIFAILLTIAYWPHTPLAAMQPRSLEIRDRNGVLLRLTLARDDRYRVWTPLDEISPTLVSAVQLQEDRWFRWHPGFNPISLMRGAWVSYVGVGARQGGSTLTMQLARLLWRMDTRSPSGKLKQVARAVQLELYYSKDQILEAYLNYAPYGGNVEGVGAASLIYFDKRAQALTLPEALTLAVLPQNPNRRGQVRGDMVSVEMGAALRTARDRLFERWLVEHPEDDAQRERFALPLPLGSTRALPFAAPHFVDRVIAERGLHEWNGQNSSMTTLDLGLQHLIERRTQTYLTRSRRRGLDNAAVMLVDTRDMAVRALLGSADYGDAAIAGQVDGTGAKRSPGSTLKPLIYALAIDQGVLHPATVLRDVPTAFGPFAPENFDGRFVGPITATDALIHSRNIPAVSVAAKLSQPSFYEFLRRAGISRMASEQHYGLALVLGGGEVTMAELARLYAMLSNDGVLKPLRRLSSDPRDAGVQLLSAEASFVVRDMLQHNPRPDASNASRSARLPVAWKTGTSWGFRDAWTAGIVGPYVLIVWMGNFDGGGNPALIGVDAAAPLFFDIVDALQASGTSLDEPARRWPLNLARVEICRASGDLPNAQCPQRGETWFIPGKSPIRVSNVHRAVAIAKDTGLPSCGPIDPRNVRMEVHEYWPSDLANVFAQAGMPRKAPPVNPACPDARPALGTPPQITSPRRATTYALRIARSDQAELSLQANADADVREVFWFVNGSFIASAAPNAAVEWRPEHAGRYRLRAVDDHGRADTREIEVTAAL